MQYSRFHGRPCPYCGDAMVGNGLRRPTRDHVIPKRFQGTSFEVNPGNKLIVCWQCNNDKAHHTLEVWAERLRCRSDPRHLLILAVIRSRAIFTNQIGGCAIHPNDDARHLIPGA